jgi:hypothetical protein
MTGVCHYDSTAWPELDGVRPPHAISFYPKKTKLLATRLCPPLPRTCAPRRKYNSRKGDKGRAMTNPKFHFKCSVCAEDCLSFEIVPPHAAPPDLSQWSLERQQTYEKHRVPDRFYLIYKGRDGDDSTRNIMDSDEAARILSAFSDPTVAHLRENAEELMTHSTLGWILYDSGGYCMWCSAFFCSEHWYVTGEERYCPNHHCFNIDPHWHPDD